MAQPDPSPVTSSHPAPTLGRYKIVRVVARSNDIVYEALDPGMNRRVAVKELALSPNVTGQQRRERIERFYREAKAAGNLKHQNIVTVYEVGQEGERHFIAMEYLEGPSLRDILRMRTVFPVREAFAIVLQLADALGYAHAQGVVHRDVKPDNIHLVLPNDRVKLTDFGIARILADPAITSTGQVFGTPSYMSPEQIMAGTIDHRTDIFALGVLLYELIVGKKPFQGDSVITITYHIMNSQPTIPSNIPSGVAQIITRALAKDPNLRYQNMQSLIADIHSEMAFADSPYHQENTSGMVNAQDMLSEQTQMISQGDLPRPDNTPPARPPGQFAPATGMEAAVSGGYVQPSNAPSGVLSEPEFSPMPVTEQSNYGPVLVLSIAGTMILIVLLVFLIARAYKADEIAEEQRQAVSAYDSANSALQRGDRLGAQQGYNEAAYLAPPGSEIKRHAMQSLNGLTADTNAPSPATPDSSAPGTGALPTSANATAGSGSQTADSHYQRAQQYRQQGDEDDAVTEFAAAAEADPTGDTGRKAQGEAAKDYSAMADKAFQAGDLAKARTYWQSVIKIAPTDPLADTARQNILTYGETPLQPAPGASGSTNPSAPNPSPAPANE